MRKALHLKDRKQNEKKDVKRNFKETDHARGKKHFKAIDILVFSERLKKCS